MFRDSAVSVRLPAAVSKSPTVNGISAVDMFWEMVWFAMSVMVGGSFWLLTVTAKVRLTVLFWLAPSLTVTVILAEPLALAAGVKLRTPEVLGLV